jgi:hypothetical protein
VKREELGPFAAWSLGLLLLIATMIITRWVIEFATWSALDSGWAQALGGIAAIAASFGFFYSQKRADIIRGEAESVLTATKAIIAVHTLCDWSINAMETAYDQMECQHAAGVVPFEPARFDELRQLFSHFVDPSSNLIILHTALAFSNLLMEAKHDLPIAADQRLGTYVLSRSRDRIVTAEALSEQLKAQRNELLDACSRYRVNPIAGPMKAPPAP